MARKTRAFEEEGSAIGHNSGNDDQRRIYFTKALLSIREEERALKGKIKDLLNEAKDEGFLKTSIKNAAKILEASEEKYQSDREVIRETKHIIQLFADHDGQYSFLRDSEAA